MPTNTLAQKKEEPVVVLILRRSGVEIRYADEDSVASERALLILSRITLALDSLKQSLVCAFESLDQEEAMRIPGEYQQSSGPGLPIGSNS